MTYHSQIRPSRRAFLAGSAGLVVGLYLAPLGRARAAALDPLRADAAGAAGQFAPNAFVRIAPDGIVTVLSKHIEMGEGTYTGLAVLAAEELDADWSQVRAEAAPADVEKYKNLAFGAQGSGGSTAIANSYEQMRMAGATARALLVAAAAQEWGVPAAEISVANGRVAHAASGKESGFGPLAEIAATLPPPVDVKLKDPKDFRLIGTDVPRLDMRSKSDGTAIFTLDVMLPGTVVAMVAHAPQFGATVKSFDDAAARAVKGVIDVKQVSQGVAVYADNTWAALKGRDALKVEWEAGKAETRTSAALIEEYHEKAKTPGLQAASTGDIAAMAAKPPSHEAEYVFPYLAHAPLEPLDAVIVKAEDGVFDVFMGSQSQTSDHMTIAGVLGVGPEQVRINTLFAGGSFGRRAQPASQYAAEAAEVFKAFGAARPVKHMWTREDDIRGGFYRPIYVHRLKGWLDGGAIVGWDHTIVGQSILNGSAFEAFMVKNGVDATSVEGATELPYSIPNHRVTLHSTEVGVPVLWWRSVGSTHTAFSTETFVDELLERAGKDAVAGRLEMIADERHRGVLTRVAEMADWGVTPPDGRVRGVALHKSFSTYVAQIAEVSIGADAGPKVHKVWCAVDCGVPVTPNVIRAQMEGGLGYGLGAILFDEITLGEGGRVTQSNFHDYRSLRINEMPDVEVDVIRSTVAPTGVGEPGTPPIGPAVANAWRALTKEPVRRLPIRAVAAA